MKKRPVEVIRGRGSVYRDLKKENADIEQLKAILAAEIIKALDREGLTVREAQARTGIAAADFSRIRNADFARFTADRLMSIINGLGSRIEVAVKVRRAEAHRRAPALKRLSVVCYRGDSHKGRMHCSVEI
jgi:predicted XRE-type DNA-binding protein